MMVSKSDYFWLELEYVLRASATRVAGSPSRLGPWITENRVLVASRRVLFSVEHHAPELSNSFNGLSMISFTTENLLLRGADQIPSEGAGSECAAEDGKYL
jgi:hypothetical protein